MRRPRWRNTARNEIKSRIESRSSARIRRNDISDGTFSRIGKDPHRCRGILGREYALWNLREPRTSLARNDNEYDNRVPFSRNRGNVAGAKPKSRLMRPRMIRVIQRYGNSPRAFLEENAAFYTLPRTSPRDSRIFRDVSPSISSSRIATFPLKRAPFAKISLAFTALKTHPTL